MIANQEIVNAINLQIGNEFGAMLQYYAIGAHFAAEGQSELSAHFYEQAEEEKKDALRIIQFVIDTGARVNIPAVAVPRADFKVAEYAIKLSLEQEARVTAHTNALVSMARAAHFINDFKTPSEPDRTADNFLQWLVEKQSEEVALLEQLLRTVQSTSEGDLVRVKEHLAHEKGPGSPSIELGQPSFLRSPPYQKWSLPTGKGPSAPGSRTKKRIRWHPILRLRLKRARRWRPSFPMERCGKSLSISMRRPPGFERRPPTRLDPRPRTGETLIALRPRFASPSRAFKATIMVSCQKRPP